MLNFQGLEKLYGGCVICCCPFGALVVFAIEVDPSGSNKKNRLVHFAGGTQAWGREALTFSVQ